MNLDLYNSEFRDFKYLKSSAEDVAYFKRKASEVDRIQLGPEANDPAFVWPCRLEFVEQLLDLRNDSVYIVQPCNYSEIGSYTKAYGYDDVRVYTIKNPIIVYGPITDLKRLEDDELMFRDNLCVCSDTDKTEQVVIKLSDIGLIPSTLSHVAVFYDKEWAEKYKQALIDYLRKSNDAVSAISRLF